MEVAIYITCSYLYTFYALTALYSKRHYKKQEIVNWDVKTHALTTLSNSEIANLLYINLPYTLLLPLPNVCWKSKNVTHHFTLFGVKLVKKITPFAKSLAFYGSKYSKQWHKGTFKNNVLETGQVCKHKGNSLANFYRVKTSAASTFKMCHNKDSLR